MNVANRKCIRRLSVASFKAAKVRNIITIAAIALTTILFTVIFTVVMSIKYGFEQSNFRQVGGYSHGGFKYLTEEQLEELKDDPLIKEYGLRMFCGMPDKAPFQKSHVEISYCDENTAKWMFLEPKADSPAPQPTPRRCLTSTRYTPCSTSSVMACTACSHAHNTRTRPVQTSTATSSSFPHR